MFIAFIHFLNIYGRNACSFDQDHQITQTVRRPPKLQPAYAIKRSFYLFPIVAPLHCYNLTGTAILAAVGFVRVRIPH